MGTGVQSWAAILGNSTQPRWQGGLCCQYSEYGKETLCRPARLCGTRIFSSLERWMSGLSRTPGKRVQANSLSGVRIPLSANFNPSDNRVCQKTLKDKGFQGFFIAKDSQGKVWTQTL